MAIARSTATIEPVETIADHKDDWETAIRKFLWLTGRTIKADYSQSLRHNCAGCVVQIAYSLLEAYEKRLDLTPGHSVVAGPSLRGVPFTRALWASRNAFAHGDGWRNGTDRSDNAKKSLATLRQMGIEDPENADSFTLYSLLCDDSDEEFLQRLLRTGKDLSERSAPAQKSNSVGGWIALGILGLGVLAALADSVSDPERKRRINFRYTGAEGEIVIRIAVKGKVQTEDGLRKLVAAQAVKALSPARSKQFTDVEEQSEAFGERLTQLLALPIESARFHDALLELCDEAEALYEAYRVLEDPFAALLVERGGDSREDMENVLRDLLSGYECEVVDAAAMDQQLVRHPWQDA